MPVYYFEPDLGSDSDAIHVLRVGLVSGSFSAWATDVSCPSYRGSVGRKYIRLL